MSQKYNHQEIESKWRSKWRDNKLYEPDVKSAKEPFYNLMMFPYPSAEGLHVGNMYAFTGADVYGRFQRMLGKDVFEPIGLDGFGIHSENYAIKVGKHPAEQAKISQERFYEQLNQIGNGFAWNERLETYDPGYYKWTQWLFTEMFKHGLAYRKSARVNWCPSCKTVLADEQVEAGVCERCKSETTFKDLEQWFFKITDYAEQLLADIDLLKWPGKIKTAQKNWIGKSTGLNIHFEVEGLGSQITVWTKFWETVFGTTYLVVAPEYPLIERLIEQADLDKRKEIIEYVKQAKEKTETQRKQEEKEKTGIFTGSYAVNPVNGQRVPIWIADYVLMDVGTGAVMGVPAHDYRDFDFAKKYQLPIIQVVSYTDNLTNEKVRNGEQAFEGEGKLVNSGQFDGMEAWGEGKSEMAEWMIAESKAEWLTTYHLRDWLISRQRYWGPPIPMIFCEQCATKKVSWFDTDDSRIDPEGSLDWNPAGWYPMELADLPVELPTLADFKPKGDGSAPLDNASDEWLYTTCPHCGGKAKRETDVSDTFLDSSWYFLAYPNLATSEWKAEGDVGKGNKPWNDEIVRKWMPVNAYIGGAEHAVLHLLYARFVWKTLQDWGYLVRLPDAEAGGKEPFPFLFGHGLIIKDGAKMSKSRGNVVNPDEYIRKYGADTLRAYLMFLGPYDQGGDFRDTGIAGMRRFLDRVWKTFEEANFEETPAEVKSKLQETMVKVRLDYADFKFNTAIAAIMECINTLKEKGNIISRDDAGELVKMMAPITPYVAEELWHLVKGHAEADFSRDASVHYQPFPMADMTAISIKPITIVVQVNGKTRASLAVDQDRWQTWTDKKEMALAEAKKVEQVSKRLEGKEILKVIWIEPSENRHGMLNVVIE